MIVDTRPYWHCVVDDFFDDPDSIANEFPDQTDPCWFSYDNPLEIKQTCNDWHKFGPNVYAAFTELMSPVYATRLSMQAGCLVVPDYGLHGGGLHQHGSGGKLNVHLDYNLHPKLPLQRRLNLIVYLTKDWKDEWGGHLGLYENQTKLSKKILPKYNRAVIFDTRNAWHGLPEPIKCPPDVTRKSIAVYYLCEPESYENRKRALFAPTAEQQGDPDIEMLIRKRANL